MVSTEHEGVRMAGLMNRKPSDAYRMSEGAAVRGAGYSPFADEWFINIWERCTDDFLAFEEMASLPRPEGVSAQSVWDGIAALKKHAGITMPYKLYLPLEGLGRAGEARLPEGSSRDVWFFQSRKMVSIMNQLTMKARASSHLQGMIQEKLPSPVFLLYLIGDELFFVLQRDGLEYADRKKAEEVILKGRAPRTPAETVLKRLCGAFLSTSSLMRRDITRGVIEYLYESLAHDVAVTASRPSRLNSLSGYERFSEAETFDAIWNLIHPRDSEIMPIIAASSVEGLLWDQAPLPALNNAVGYLLRKIMLEQAGMPAIAFTPYSRTFFLWQGGGLDGVGGMVPYGSTQNMRLSGCGFDATAFYLCVLQLHLRNLEDLVERVDRFRCMEESVDAQLGALANVNDRQRRMMSRFFTFPHDRIGIKEYCEAYAVVYSTGRADLIDLAERGYLNAECVSRSYIFTAGPRLVALFKAALDWGGLPGGSPLTTSDNDQ